MSEEKKTTEVTTEQSQQKTEETTPMVNMTQADFDDKIKGITAKERKKAAKEFESSDEYKAFKDWQENSKTDQQRMQDQLDKIPGFQQTISDLQKELNGYKNKDVLRTQNVDDKFLDYVNFEVNKMVNDDTDFGEALTAYLQNNQQYIKGQAETQSNKGFTTGQRHTDNKDVSSLADQMESMLFGSPSQK